MRVFLISMLLLLITSRAEASTEFFKVIYEDVGIEAYIQYDPQTLLGAIIVPPAMYEAATPYIKSQLIAAGVGFGDTDKIDLGRFSNAEIIRTTLKYEVENAPEEVVDKSIECTIELAGCIGGTAMAAGTWGLGFALSSLTCIHTGYTCGKWKRRKFSVRTTVV